MGSPIIIYLPHTCPDPSWGMKIRKLTPSRPIATESPFAEEGGYGEDRIAPLVDALDGPDRQEFLITRNRFLIIC